MEKQVLMFLTQQIKFIKQNLVFLISCLEFSFGTDEKRSCTRKYKM